MTDSLGYAGNMIMEKLPEWGPMIVQFLLIPIGAFIFRAIQKKLQKLPTKWRWVNNKLTVSILSKIIGAIFGKTTLIYNAQVTIKTPNYIKTDEEAAKTELKKQAQKHLSRYGGEIKAAFEEAMEKLKK